MTENNNRDKPYHGYIYLITNNLNGKTYVGQRKLYSPYVTPETDGYMGSGSYLFNAKKKYGVENFSKEILAECYSRDILNILEIQYIKLYREIGKAEYNIANGGLGNEGGHPVSEETKEKIRRWNLGKIVSEETREKLRKNNKSRTPEVKEKLRQANLGKHPSEETRKKLSLSQKGKIISEEQKKILSDIRKGKPLTFEVWNKGKHGIYSEETLRKISEGHKGMKMSPETLAKRSESVKNYKTWTDGIHEMRCEECPGEGWYRGRSESYKKASSESHKGIVTRGSKGMHWWNNGIENKLAFDCPGEGWVPGRLPSYGESMKGKLRESNKGFHWWTNGKEDVMAKECPGKGWVLGRNNQEAIGKMSEKQKGKTSNIKGTKWFTDGTVNVRARECPPGFRPGRSADVNNKIAEANRQSYLSGSHSREGKNAGKHWCHNETEEKFCVEIPDGWLPGRLSR